MILFSVSLADPLTPVDVFFENPVGVFLASFIFFIPCMLTELAVYDWLIKKKTLFYKFSASVLINIITFFPANIGIWFGGLFGLIGGLFRNLLIDINPIDINPFVAFLLIVGHVEFIVIIVEGIMLKYLFDLELKKALKVSAVANVASFAFSFLNFMSI